VCLREICCRDFLICLSSVFALFLSVILAAVSAHLRIAMIYFILILSLARHIYAQYAGVQGLFFGPAYMVSPPPSASIVEYSTILTVPKVPNFSKGLLVIWPGINTPGDPTNLVQTCIGVGGAKS
jgi:hypothetical protein